MLERVEVFLEGVQWETWTGRTRATPLYVRPKFAFSDFLFRKVSLSSFAFSTPFLELGAR